MAIFSKDNYKQKQYDTLPVRMVILTIIVVVAMAAVTSPCV